jgi:hypothetical protein
MAEEEKKEEQKQEEQKQEEQKEPETYQVKVNGEMRDMTLDELKENASKAAGADEKFRIAAEKEKAGTKGLELAKAFEKVNSGEFTAADVRHLAELTGQDPDEAVATYTANLKKAEEDDKKTQTPPAGAPPRKLEMKDLPEDVQETIGLAREAQIADAEKKIKEMVSEAVDKDEFLGKIVIEAPEESQTGIKEAITSMVQRDVRAKILASPSTKEKFGAEMIRNSIQMARAEVKKLGIPSKSSKQADKVSLLAALGPTGLGLPAEVYSDDEVERVPSTDPDYHDNAVKRLGQKLAQGLRGRMKTS